MLHRIVFRGFMNQTVITLITLVWLLVAAVVGNAAAQHCYSSSTSPQFPGTCNYFADDECQQYQAGCLMYICAANFCNFWSGAEQARCSTTGCPGGADPCYLYCA